jgi:hypothetical protein
MQDGDVLVLVGKSPGLLVVFHPLDQQRLLAHPTNSLDHQGQVLLELGLQPILDPQEVLLKASDKMVLIVSDEDITGVNIIRILLQLLVSLIPHQSIPNYLRYARTASRATPQSPPPRAQPQPV